MLWDIQESGPLIRSGLTNVGGRPDMGYGFDASRAWVRPTHLMECEG